jgi:selenocysteine lyase/cysteine desulfurase
VDWSGLRAEFPVLARSAYLNAGTDGPLPGAAARASTEELERELEVGRSATHFQRRGELNSQLRGAYARALSCEPEDVALTSSTTEGLCQVIAGLELGPGDEIITSDEEHPGLLGPLAAARELRGVTVKQVPFAEVASAVGPKTKLVACSHVGWMSGSFAPVELGDLEIPVLLDGAQGVGAVPVDVAELGCDAYAGAGQKWLCGPDGTGMLFVAPALRERLSVTRRGYGNMAKPDAGLDAGLQPDSRRFDIASISAETVACSLAAVSLLESAGWAAVHERARELAAGFARTLAEYGREPAPRGESTLVSFHSDDPEGERERLAERGIVLRNIPGRPWLRASIGAWNDESDLERLLDALA